MNNAKTDNNEKTAVDKAYIQFQAMRGTFKGKKRPGRGTASNAGREQEWTKSKQHLAGPRFCYEAAPAPPPPHAPPPPPPPRSRAASFNSTPKETPNCVLQCIQERPRPQVTQSTRLWKK